MKLILVFIDFHCSALVLPWVGEDARVEHGIDIRTIHIGFLEVLSILVFKQITGFHVHLQSVEVLVRCLRETWSWWHCIWGSDTCSILKELTIELIGFFPSSSQSITDEISWLSMAEWLPPCLIVVSWDGPLLLAHYLWPGAELELIILREILNDSLISMQVS